MKITRVEHVAVAVDDMHAVKRALEDVLGLTMEYEEELDAAKIAMYPVGGTYLELVQATSPDSGTARWVAQHGRGFHHICLEVEDIEAALRELRAKNVALLDERPRRGHGGTLIAFIDPRATGDVLVELVQGRG